MTTMDGVFVALAALDLLALAVLVSTALAIAATARRGRDKAQPAIQRSAGLVRSGAQVVEHARSSSERINGCVRGVTTAVRRRVETTRKIAASLGPAASETAGAVRESGADIVGKAVSAGTFLRRAQRLRAAAEAASAAARRARADGADADPAVSDSFTPRSL